MASAPVRAGPSAVVCQPKSARCTPDRRATKLPAPGRVSTRPSITRRCNARCTVSGLAACSRTRVRVDGSRSPAGRVAVNVRSRRSMARWADSPSVPATRVLSSSMKPENSAIVSSPPLLSAPAVTPAGTPVAAPADPAEPHASSTAGLLFGLLGVLAFSFTLPLTRVAVHQLDPLFVGAGRAVLAGLLAIGVLAALRQRLPRGGQWVRLAVVATGVIAGFPILTSYALQTVPAAHGAVVIGLLPAATAIVAVLRARERPSARFWLASGLGVVAVAGFVALTSGGLHTLAPADLLLVGAVALAAIGYGEGALLSRELGSWQTICWALIVALPVMLPLMLAGLGSGWPEADAPAWLAFAYLAGVSMFLGFFAWYRGLAIGPIARVSQIQLVQPVLTIVWATLLLGERLDPVVLVGALAVILCAATAVRARIR
ncbi:DMT family transporter [Cryobacterium lactosi]|uniref:DMT family transporter n=2 Tax=Cryobacterium lactosi TaxID=1259202 RepID=A0A4R9C233_9MICO|nr:DMT family transporter [Cryobacterium lactosi]